jgi:hypothetical protein
MMDLRKASHGHVAGVDLLLELTNEREFHVPITNREGKTVLSATSPFLLHLRPLQSIRKLMSLVIEATNYEEDRIEDSFDLGEEPTVGEDFDVGEAPLVDAEPVGEEIDGPIEAEVTEVTADEVERQTLREMCADVVLALGWSTTRLVNFARNTFKENVDPATLDGDRLKTLHNALIAERDKA